MSAAEGNGTTFRTQFHAPNSQTLNIVMFVLIGIPALALLLSIPNIGKAIAAYVYSPKRRTARASQSLDVSKSDNFLHMLKNEVNTYLIIFRSEPLVYVCMLYMHRMINTSNIQCIRVCMMHMCMYGTIHVYIWGDTCVCMGRYTCIYVWCDTLMFMVDTHVCTE